MNRAPLPRRGRSHPVSRVVFVALLRHPFIVGLAALLLFGAGLAALSQLLLGDFIPGLALSVAILIVGWLGLSWFILRALGRADRSDNHR